MFSLFLDRIRHDVLDGIQPYHNLGLAGVVLRAGLLLQLRDRGPLRGLADGRAHAGHVLVHRCAYRELIIYSPVIMHRHGLLDNVTS